MWTSLVAPAISLLLGLFPMALHPSYDTIEQESEVCYTTFDGIKFRATKVDCPSQALIESELDKMRGRVNMPFGYMDGLTVYFTHSWIWSPSGDAYGVAFAAENKVYVWWDPGDLDESIDTLCHEIGHRAYLQAGVDWNVIHTDSQIEFAFTYRYTRDNLLVGHPLEDAFGGA